MRQPKAKLLNWCLYAGGVLCLAVVSGIAAGANASLAVLGVALLFAAFVRSVP